MKTFPVMWPHDRATEQLLRILQCPRSVPWDLVEAHATQAHRNHHQDLVTLAQRGGLDAAELVAVLEDRRFARMSWGDAVARLRAIAEATP